MNSHRTRAFLACAAIVGLTGCSSLSPAGSEPAPAEPAAVEAPAPAAPAAPAAAPDVLERLNDRPYGYGTTKIQELLTGATVEMELDDRSVTFNTALNLGVDQDGVDLTDAVRTAMQVVWVGDERDTIFNGWRLENIRGNVKDIEHFVAPSAMANYLPEAQRALAAAEVNEAAGTDPTEAFDYVLHPGKMAQVGEATSAENKAAWPDHQDSVVWMTFRGEGVPDQVVPIPLDAKTDPKLPMVMEIHDAPGDGDPTGAVIVHITNEVKVPAGDGRTVVMGVGRSIQVGLEDGRWVVQSNEWEIFSTQIFDS